MADDVHRDEYTLIQGKIDRIGEFRFIVRGWAVTLASTIVGATEIAKLHPATMLLAPVALALFSAVEREQNRLERALISRAIRLETHFKVALAQAAAAAGKKPGIPAPRVAQVLSTVRPKTFLDHALHFAHRLFYVILSALVIVLFFLRLWMTQPQEPKPPDAAQRAKTGIAADTPAKNEAPRTKIEPGRKKP